MKADRYDLALAGVAKDGKHPVIVITDERSYATDGYIFAQRTRGHRYNVLTGLQQFISPQRAAELRKQVPTSAKAVREETDFVETDMVYPDHDVDLLHLAADLFDESQGGPRSNRTVIREGLNDTAALDVCIDPELFAKAIKYLFDGHTKGLGRKGLRIRVYWAKFEGRHSGRVTTFPIYLLTNKDDTEGRSVVVCGQSRS